MDKDHQITRNLHEALGMNHVRSVKDLYNIRLDTLEGRLSLKKNKLGRHSRVSIYVAWLQHKVCVESCGTEEKIDLVNKFCAFLIKLGCPQDMLRQIWKECVTRAMSDARRSERVRIRDDGDFVDEQIRSWFRQRDRFTSDALLARGRSATRSSRHWSPDPKSTARCASHWTPGARSSSRATQQPPVPLVDEWGTNADEYYQCPNCLEYGTHYVNQCPMSNAWLHRGSQGGDYGAGYRNLTSSASAPSWGEIPPPDHRCWLCGEVGDHYQNKCPRSLSSAVDQNGRVVDEWADCRLRDHLKTNEDVRPTTERPDTAVSRESGEVDERRDPEDEAQPFSPERQRSKTRQGTKRLRGPFISYSSENDELEDEEGDVDRMSRHPDSYSGKPPEKCRLVKRTRVEARGARCPAFFIDTARTEAAKVPRPANTRILAWQSNVHGSQRVGERNETSVLAHELVEYGAEPIQETDSTTRQVQVTSPCGYREPGPYGDRPARGSDAETDCTSRETTPMQTPRRLHRAQTPVHMTDITIRPARLPHRPAAASQVGGVDDVEIKTECDDITDMINALEDADAFLDQLASELNDQQSSVERSSFQTEPVLPSLYLDASSRVRNVSLEQHPASESSNIDTYFSHAENAVAGGASASRPRGLGRMSPSRPGSSPTEATGIEGPGKAQSTLPVLELFKGRAPARLRTSFRPAATDLCISPGVADCVEDVDVGIEDIAASDEAQVKVEATGCSEWGEDEDDCPESQELMV